MAARERWNAESMFDVYLHDYMVKNKMHKTAAIFKREANIPDHTVAIQVPEGFLHEWWSMFTDKYFSNQIDNTKEKKAEDSIQAMQIEEATNQQHDCPNEPPAEFLPHQQIPPPFMRIDDYGSLLEKPAATYSEFETIFDPIGLNKLNLSCPVASTSSFMAPQTFDQLKQGNCINLGGAEPMDHMLSAFQNGIFSTLGPHCAEMSNGVDSVPQNGWLGNAANNQQQSQLTPSEQHCLPLDTSSTSGSQTSNPVNPTELCSSSSMNTKNETKCNRDQMIVLPTNSVGQQNQYDLPQRLPIRRGRKKKGPPNLRTGANLMNNDSKSGVENVNYIFSEDGDNIDSPSVSKNQNQGINLEEVDTIRSSKHALTCCQLSLDGNLLAFAGSEGKVFIRNFEARYALISADEHSCPVTDIRARPNSSFFVTSSLDKTLKKWNGFKPGKVYNDMRGHSGEVMSLDFHPRNTDLLCSCDSNNEIRMWSFANLLSINTFKGATKQVRFQPNFEKLLATASGKMINLFDVQTSNLLLSFKGHNSDVLSVCWDVSGQYILSVSEDSARLWSMKLAGKCIHELAANNRRFRSCTFHPAYPNIGIIGAHKSLELWSPGNSSGMLTIPAHEGLVTSLAQSGQTSMIASASDDCCVKLWK